MRRVTARLKTPKRGARADMIGTGDILEHPVTRERVRFMETTSETNGERLLLEFRVRPHGFVAAEHIHPQQDERFEVLSGTMRYRINGEEHEAGAGTVLYALKGTPHIWWNGGQDELHMLVSYEPALQTQEFFESFFSIAQQGRTNARTGMPNPLQTAVIAREFAAEIRLAWPPLAVQKVILGTLAALGRMLGYRARHSYPVAEQRPVP
jgi:quercetin dioxygenase-like cupin family protein